MQFNYSDGYQNTRLNTYKFLGLDRGHYTYKGEMEDSYNMAADEYPCAAPRMPRVKVCDLPDNVQAVAAPDVYDTDSVTGFTGIADEQFYYNGVIKSSNFILPSSYTWSIARLVTAYVLNGYDPSTNTSLMYVYDIDTGDFTRAGVVMDKLIVTAGTNNVGNYLAAFHYRYTYVDEHTVTDSHGNVIRNSDFFDKYFNGNTVSSANIFEKYFSVGDKVSISGFPSLAENVGQVWYYTTSNGGELRVQPGAYYDENNTVDLDAYSSSDAVSDWQVTEAVVKGFRSVLKTTQHSDTYIHYIYLDLYDKYGNAIDFIETSGSVGNFYVSGVTLSNMTHVFDTIAAHQGRLWGTLPTGNILYGSTSNNMFDFHSIDEYAAPLYARLASSYPGRITGIAEFGLDLLVFKDDLIGIVSGDDHSNHAVSRIFGIGCIDKNSIQITPQGVIFLGFNGFYLYNGSQFPTKISNKLYDTRYVSAMSGFDGVKYYACAVRPDGEREFLTYDLRYSLWHLQDSSAGEIAPRNAVNAAGMFRFKGDFYLADLTSGELLRYDRSGNETFIWSFTSVSTHNNTLDNKALTEIWLRAECIDGGSFSVSVSVDGGEFKACGSHSNPNMTVYRVPIRMNNGSSFRYRITGKGKVIIYEAELHTPSGGRDYRDYDRDTSGDTEHEIIPETVNADKHYLI